MSGKGGTATEKRFNCSCGMHCVVLTAEQEDGSVELCFWRMGDGLPYRLGRYGDWFLRLRQIGRILLHGTPYSDFVVLDKETAQRLAASLPQPVVHKFPSGWSSTVGTSHISSTVWAAWPEPWTKGGNE